MRFPPAQAVPRPVTPIGIVADRLRRVIEDIEHTSDVGAGLLAELHDLAELAAGLEPYASSCTTAESPALQRLALRTATHDWDGSGSSVEQEMLSGHVEGRFLAMLVHLTRARRVLDVGMFTGYSALAMAEALPDGGEVIACEVDPQVAAFAQVGFDESEHGSKIAVYVGPALSTLAELATSGTPFDLVFLDADKSGYAAYLDLLLESGLLAPDAVVCVDNTLLQGESYRPGRRSANGDAIARFNDLVVADHRVEQVLIPLRDGITLIRAVAAGPAEGEHG